MYFTGNELLKELEKNTTDNYDNYLLILDYLKESLPLELISFSVKPFNKQTISIFIDKNDKRPREIFITTINFPSLFKLILEILKQKELHKVKLTYVEYRNPRTEKENHFYIDEWRKTKFLKYKEEIILSFKEVLE